MAVNPLSRHHQDNDANSYTTDKNDLVARRVTGCVETELSDKGLGGNYVSSFWQMFESKFECVHWNRVAQNEDTNYYYVLLVETDAIKGGYKVSKNTSGTGNDEAFLLTDADITLAVQTLPDATVLNYTPGDIMDYGVEFVPVTSARLTATTSGVEAKAGATRLSGRVNIVIYNASNKQIFAGADLPTTDLIPIERKQSKVYVVNDLEKIVVKTETGTADFIVEEIHCGSVT